MGLLVDGWIIIFALIFIGYKFLFPNGARNYVAYKKEMASRDGTYKDWDFQRFSAIDITDETMLHDYFYVKHRDEMWNRIEKYKENHPEYCEIADQPWREYSWGKVGQYRLPPGSGEKYECVMDLLVQSMGRYRSHDLKTIASDSKRAKWMYKNLVPPTNDGEHISAWKAKLRSEAEAERAEKAQWPERFPRGKFVEIDPYKYSKEENYRRDVDFQWKHFTSDDTKHRYKQWLVDHGLDPLDDEIYEQEQKLKNIIEVKKEYPALDFVDVNEARLAKLKALKASPDRVISADEDYQI